VQKKIGKVEKEKVIGDMKILNEKLKTAEAKLTEVEKKWMHMQLMLPSVPLKTVPVGKDDSENVEKRTNGKIPKFDFEIKDHVALGTALDIIKLSFHN
jgi:seryl-tRNA synthetase